jgi:hypothetical protein
VWLSPVEHCVRDAGVAGSNPATPTIISVTYTFDVFRAQRNAQQNRIVRVALIVEKRIPTTNRGETILLRVVAAGLFIIRG